jgi:hypothetical protein
MPTEQSVSSNLQTTFGSVGLSKFCENAVRIVNLWTKKTEMKVFPTKNQLSQEEVHTAVGLIQWPFDIEQFPHFNKSLVFNNKSTQKLPPC